jgi:hypothetical protein
VFIGLNIVQFVVGSYIEPRVAGAAVSVSPFMVLFAVFFWGMLWGIAGAFIGVPILISLAGLCAKNPATRGIAIAPSPGSTARYDAGRARRHGTRSAGGVDTSPLGERASRGRRPSYPVVRHAARLSRPDLCGFWRGVGFKSDCCAWLAASRNGCPAQAARLVFHSKKAV